MLSTLFVGIDVSQAEHVVCTMTADGTVRSRYRVSNDRTGIEQLIDWLVTQMAGCGRPPRPIPAIPPCESSRGTGSNWRKPWPARKIAP